MTTYTNFIKEILVREREILRQTQDECIPFSILENRGTPAKFDFICIIDETRWKNDIAPEDAHNLLLEFRELQVKKRRVNAIMENPGYVEKMKERYGVDVEDDAVRKSNLDRMVAQMEGRS